MFNLPDLRLLHRHGETWGEIEPVEHHDAAFHDPERAILKGARVFRCSQCDEEWTVMPGDATEGTIPG